jgi:enoyl-CoA hydratase/carnithine racemase
MINMIGQRKTELSLEFGKIYSPKEALSIKLVDEIVLNDDKLKERAIQCMEMWLSIPCMLHFEFFRLNSLPQSACVNLFH